MRPAGTQPAHHRDVEQSARRSSGGWQNGLRDVEALADRQPEEAWRRHADDLERLAVDAQPLVAASSRPPISRCQ